MRPALLYLVAWLGIVALVLVASRAPPTTTPADASTMAGRDVAVEGFARDIRPRTEGATFTLARDGHGIGVEVEGTPPPEGAWVRATGHVTPRAGVPTLVATHVVITPAPGPVHVPLAVLAHDPAAWQDHPITTAGTLRNGLLVDAGAGVRVGAGPWPDGGHMEVDGSLRHDPACTCHVLHATGVRPSTP